MTDKLPEINGWQIKRIQDISEVTGGSTPSTYESTYWEGDIPFVTPTDITSLKNSNYIEKTRRYITEKGLHAISSDLLEPGTILLTSRATLGEVAINKVPLVTNQGFANFKPHSDINGLWLLHYLRAQKRELERLSSGSTFKEISKKSIKRMKIPVPPLVEQRGIVEVLGTVDECIRLTDAVIERAEELKRGLMQHLLIRGIGHTEYKETPLGEIPKTWDTVKYEQANERIFVGIATSTTQHMSDNGIPLIRNQNIKEGIIDLTELRYITKRFSEANSSKMIKENDILTVRTGYTGQSCKVEKEMDGWQTFTTIISRPNLSEFDPDFMVNFLNSPLARNQILSLEAGLAQKNLNVRWISKLTIPKPPLLEQQKISQMIKKTYDYRETVINEKKHLRLIKLGLMQLLLSGNIRVELKEDGLHRIGDR